MSKNIITSLILTACLAVLDGCSKGGDAESSKPGEEKAIRLALVVKNIGNPFLYVAVAKEDQ